MATAGECKNCGTLLAGRYCSACGQKADVGIPSLGQLLAGALGDLYNLDSRVWRSLATLTFKPGRLTQYYLEGQRAKYMPPFRMYIVASVVFFLVFSLLRAERPPDAPQADDANAAVEVPAVALDAVATVEEASADGPTLTFEGDRANCSAGNADQDFVSPAVRERLEAACRNVEADGGRAFVRALVENIPMTMLVFIPFVAAIMKLLFLFSRRKYVEHLVFFFHVHTFFFVTALVTFLLARSVAVLPWLEWPARLVGYAAGLYFLAYVYVAMRHVYRQGYVLTTVKYVVLGFSYFAAFLLAVITLFTAVLLTR